jgi:CBS domain-containing protein
MKIQEVMSRNVFVCGPEDSLSQAAQRMWDGDCGCVPVLDGSGSVCGMITDRDICMAAYTQGLPLHQIQVRSAMSPQLHCCRPEDTIEHAQALMQRHRVRRAPVVDGDRLVGIVSLGDLLARSSQHARREPALRADSLVQTLVVILARNVEAEGGRDNTSRDGASSSHATAAHHRS